MATPRILVPTALVTGVAFAACGTAQSQPPAPPSAEAAASRLVARLYAPTHRPKANRPWRIRITARTQNGKPVSAEVRYQFLFNGVVVARRSHYRFRGSFRDTLTWPKSSVGRRLTFRAVVSSRIGTRNLDYWVLPRR